MKLPLAQRWKSVKRALAGASLRSFRPVWVFGAWLNEEYSYLYLCGKFRSTFGYFWALQAGVFDRRFADVVPAWVPLTCYAHEVLMSEERENGYWLGWHREDQRLSYKKAVQSQQAAAQSKLKALKAMEGGSEQ